MGMIAIQLACLGGLGTSALLSPVILGISLLIRSRHTSLGRMAGLLTLKVIIATPLWLGILSAITMTKGIAPTLDSVWVSFVTVFPDILLTVAAVAVFRKTLVGQHAAKAWVLIALDSLRWGNNLLLTLTTAAYRRVEPWASIGVGTAYFALAIPTVIAVAAAWLSRQTIIAENAAQRRVEPTFRRMG